MERTPRFTVAAACVGNAVEWYDFAIYGALGVVLTQLFLPADDPDTVLLAAFALYAFCRRLDDMVDVADGADRGKLLRLRPRGRRRTG